MDDSALLEQLIAGSASAAAELLHRYSGTVRRMLIATLGTTLDVDDIVQETFITAIRRAPTLRDDAALFSFIVGIALRHARNEQRRRAVRRSSELLDEDLPGVRPPDWSARAAVRRLAGALDRLDPRSRVVFVRRYVEQLDLAALARAEHVSLATVKRRLSRARRAFVAIAASDPLLREYAEPPAVAAVSCRISRWPRAGGRRL